MLWTIFYDLACCDLVYNTNFSTLSSPWGEQEKRGKPVPSKGHDALL